jgi:integrase/recombinase XerD
MAKKIITDWSMAKGPSNLKPAVTRYRKYLERLGFKQNTIKLYTLLIGNYLKKVNTEMPTTEDAQVFYDSLHEQGLSRSAINNYTAALIKYHAMINQPIKLKFLKLNNSLPYVFDEADIIKIFSACNNLKHHCMLKVLFFGCLRSGELCHLDVSDYDPNNLTLRLRETKNNSDAIAIINDETARYLNQYLKAKPNVIIKGCEPLFVTDFGNRWTNNGIHKMFMYYKEQAKISKKGGVHCFSRHSSATLMIARGCDLRSVQALLRHRDIHTTLRYTHLTDTLKREKYNQYLTL